MGYRVPTCFVGRDLCVPLSADIAGFLLANGFHPVGLALPIFLRADCFHPVGRGLSPAAVPQHICAALFQSTASAVTTLLHFSLFHLTLTKGRRPPPAMGWGRRPYCFAVGVAPSADGALGRYGSSPRARGGCFARCGGREFRALRGATRGAASGLRDFLKKIE